MPKPDRNSFLGLVCRRMSGPIELALEYLIDNIERLDAEDKYWPERLAEFWDKNGWLSFKQLTVISVLLDKLGALYPEEEEPEHQSTLADFDEASASEYVC